MYDDPHVWYPIKSWFAEQWMHYLDVYICWIRFHIVGLETMYENFFFRQGQHGHLPCSCCLQESDVSCRQGFHVYLHGFLCSGDLGSVIYEVPYVDSSWWPLNRVGGTALRLSDDSLKLPLFILVVKLLQIWSPCFLSVSLLEALSASGRAGRKAHW